jgi:hypothetical protein
LRIRVFEAPTKETGLTQFNLSTESVPTHRLPHQRPIKGTSSFGDRIQANGVQKLATSSIQINKTGVVSTSHAHQSGLAISTRPGRSGDDMRPGMVSFPQRKDFVVVPVPDKSKKLVPSSIITNVPTGALPTVDVPASSPVITSIPVSSGVHVGAASPVVGHRAIPQSLFLTEDNSSADSPLPSIHPTPNVEQAGVITFLVPANDNPDLHESSIDDSLDPSDGHHDFGSDCDGLPGNDSHQDDDVHLNSPSPYDDVIPTNSRDSAGPCTVTFGPAYDLHETHQGVFTESFERCFCFLVVSEVKHLLPECDNGHGARGPIVTDPLLIHSQHSSLPVPLILLRAHKDDDMMLSTEVKADHQYFECRIAFLCTHWNILHSCKS